MIQQHQSNFRGSYTEYNYKKQGTFSLFNSPDPNFGFLKGVLFNDNDEDDDEQSQQSQQQQQQYGFKKLINQQQQPQYQAKIQKRLFNDNDNCYEDQSYLSKNNNNNNNNGQGEINQQNQGKYFNNDIFQQNDEYHNQQDNQKNYYNFGQQHQQQQQFPVVNYYAQTTYKDRQQDGQESLLNLNMRSSRNLFQQFQQTTAQNNQGQKYQEKLQTNINQNQIQQIGLGLSSQNIQSIGQNNNNNNSSQEMNISFMKNQYLTDMINNTDSQSSNNSSYKKEQHQQQQQQQQQSSIQNNIFAQFQNQQKSYQPQQQSQLYQQQQQIQLNNKMPSSQHQQQQLIEFNRFKGFQNKTNQNYIFQTQSQLSSSSSQNKQSSNKENSQNTSHSSTSSSGISHHTFSDYQQNNNNNNNNNNSNGNNNNNNSNNNSNSDISSSSQQLQGNGQISQHIQQLHSSQKKLQQQLQNQTSPKIFSNINSRMSSYQSGFVCLKQGENPLSFEKNISLQNNLNSNQQLKTQLSDNLSYYSKPQTFSTSSSSLSSSSQIQSSNLPSCSSPSSQSSCSSEAQRNLRNLSFSSTHKTSLPSSSTGLQTNQNELQLTKQKSLQSNQQQTQFDQQFGQNQSIQKLGKQQSQQQYVGSSGKKPFGKNKQMVYYEKQISSNPCQTQQNQTFQTPIKQEAAPRSIAACQEDNYQNQYGFNSPLYTPNTIGKLAKIKESFYENTPFNEFKQRFARKIKQLRQELKDNCKTPDGGSINTGNASAQLGSSILQKEIKQKLTFIEVLGSSIGNLYSIKPNMYWKLMFELAELAKKECMYHEAKYFFKIAISLQPFCPDIWLEYAKMEEDYGNLQKAKEILENAYPFCKMSDSLILKLLRIIEKIGTIEEVRKILSSLNQIKIEKCWKIYIEGAQIEIRFGNLKNSERILKMLHHYLDLNGQVYYEYARVLELQGKYQQALHICQQAQEKGLKCTSLWTLYLKLYEKTCNQVNQQTLDKFIRMANQSLPKEIIWKIYLEIAQICEKKNDINLAKQYLIMSIKSCHESMRWKPLIQVAKIELLQGNIQNANLIIQKTLDSCSDKQKPYLIIEAAKCAEIAGNINYALTQMESLKTHMKSEWKIYMEYISMLIRNKKHQEASKIIKESLNTHTLAGRLWGELIQLEHIKATNNDLNSAFDFFLVALEEVPKSGEVWCEGARLCMNPFGNQFDLMKAKQFLEYAIFFTPQYGDSFIEALRLYTILGDRDSIKQLKSKTIISQPNYGHLWYYMKDTTRDASIDVWKKMKRKIRQEVSDTFIFYQKKLISLDISSYNSNFQQITPMITASTEYNDLFFQNSIPQDIKWKTIFYLDQSLNQI